MHGRTTCNEKRGTIYLSWTTTFLMSKKKPIVEPKRSKANPKAPPKRAWAVNGGLVVSTVLFSVAQATSLPVVQHAAQSVATLFAMIEVCGGISFDFCVEKCNLYRESRRTKKTSRLSLMMPRSLSSLYGAYKRDLKIRRSGYLQRLGIWLEIWKRKNVEGYIIMICSSIN